MSDQEAWRIAAEFEQLYCYGDIDLSDVDRKDLELWAWKAYKALWRLGQPESAKKAPKEDQCHIGALMSPAA